MSGNTGVSPPARLGQYDILHRLGVGGMAEVFLARKKGAEGTFKLLVVKRILPHHVQSRRFRAMFVAEAQVATRLNHPNIVQVYDFEDAGDEGQLLTMEYVEGPDLGRVLRAARAKGMRLPPWVSAHIIAEAAKGLHYAHERRNDEGAPLGIVHRDVSPQNILLSWDGVVKIADFGIASANLFREEGGLLKGKFGYMSPEQARADPVDRRSDIYALGVCLHEMLTGRALHGNLAGEDLLEAVRQGTVEPPSTYVRDIPSDLDTIVQKALSRDREERFQSARDMAGTIHRVMLMRQELVDAVSLETVLTQILSREIIPTPQNSKNAQSEASSLAIPQEQEEVTSAPESEKTGAGAVHLRRSVPRGAREVRHVALVMLKLSGLEEIQEISGQGRAERVRGQLRKTLEEIAYKRSTEWQWQGEEKALAVVGLWGNSSRAATEAAWLAVDIHEAMDGASRDLDVPVEASIAIVRGVASGEREMDGRLARSTMLPPAGYLALLLGERTPWGSTWVAGGLYRMVRRDFHWGDVPPVEVPPQINLTLPRTLRVYALHRPLSREERSAEALLAPGDLVGRDVEKADLHAAYHRAVSPGNGVAGAIISRVVVGEMGIGKSALVSAFLSELPPEARLLQCEISSARSDVPFGVLADLARNALGVEREAPREVLQARIVEVFGEQNRDRAHERLMDLILGHVEIAQDADDVVYRRRLVGAVVRRLLVELAGQQPLVIVCDGLQWIDASSLELIVELIRRHDPLPIFTLLVTRPDERILGQLDGVVRLDLQGLSREEQFRLVEVRLGVRTGVATVCADLLPRVAGNPFFLIEMVDALLERGALEIKANEGGDGELVRAEQGQAPLPSTLEQIIGDRLRELSVSELEVVDWLAIAGTALSSEVIQQLLGEKDAEEPISRLCARGLCDLRGEILDFRHSITRDVAYLNMAPAHRTRFHRQYGEYLLHTARPSGLASAAVAKHLARGGVPRIAADLYLEAANTARHTYQIRLAVRYYQRALQLLPEEDPRRLVAYEALEAAFRIVGRRRERKEQLAALRRAALTIAHPRWAAVALVRSARFDLDEGNLSHGINLARQAIEIAKISKVSTLEIEAQKTASELLRELGDLSGALEACDAALEITLQHREISYRDKADVLRARGAILRRLGRISEAVESYAEAIAIFRNCGARRMEARTRNSLAMAMLVAERWEDAIALALEAVRLDLSVGSRFQIAKTLTNVGMAYARLGDVPRALAYLHRARETHERYGDQDALASTLLVSAEVILDHGDSDAAHSFCTEASTLSSVTHNGYDAVHEKIVRALIARAHHDPTSAIFCASEARQEAESQALSSFHLYATSIEALSRVEVGEPHTGVLLASTVLGAVDAIPSEYGLEIRSLAWEALSKANSPSSQGMQARVVHHIHTTAAQIHDPRLRELFLQRPIFQHLFAAES